MFSRKQSKKQVVLNAVVDALPKQKKRSNKKKFIAAGVGSAIGAVVLGAATKPKDPLR